MSETKHVYCKLYKTEYGTHTIVHSDSADNIASIKSWTLVSEVFEVDIPMLDQEQQILNEVEAIDRLIDSKREECMRTIDELTTAKQELLALTHKEEEE